MVLKSTSMYIKIDFAVLVVFREIRRYKEAP